MKELVLKKVHIENYRSLVDTNLIVNDELTALIGVNGSGKTNTLSALKLLKQLVHSRARHAQFDMGDKGVAPAVITTTFLHNNDVVMLKVNVYLDESIESDNEIKYLELWAKTEGAKKWTSVDPDGLDYADYLNRMHPRRKTQLERRYLPQDQRLSDFLVVLAPYLKGVKYYGATVFSDPSKCPVSLEIDDDQRHPLRYGRGEHSRFIYDLYELKKSDRKAFKRYLNTVSHLGVRLVDDIDFAQINVPSSSIKILAGGQTQKITNKHMVIVPFFTVNGLQLPPKHLSEGTFKTLALIFYILNDDSPLMLVEEPEVCIHHGLLSSVVELIKQKSKSKQIIISTHSDYVLDRLQPENVSLVRKDASGTSIEPLNEAISSEDYSALKTYLNESGNLGEYWKEDGFFFE